MVCVFQFPEKVNLSNGMWLLFLDTLLSLEELFTGIHVPFDSEFLIAYPEVDSVITVTEVYRISSDLPLETYHFGNWTSYGGLTWPNDGFYQRRNNLQGIKLKTGYIEVRFIKDKNGAEETRNTYLMRSL
jgi:hypothetical protein